ncbi:MAG: zinc ribbon domain-containing protein [Lachnospiraceae bacterium]|jgi:hypothetical protein
MIKCSKCGTENDNNAVFCHKCGNSLVSEDEAIEEVTEEAVEVTEETVEAGQKAADEAAEVTEEAVEAATLTREEIEETLSEAVTEEIEDAVSEAEAERAAEETKEDAAEVAEEELVKADEPIVMPAPAVPAEPAAPVVPKKKKFPKHDKPIKGRAFGIIGFILGLRAIFYCWLPLSNLYGLVYSALGLIFSAISRRNVVMKLNRVGKTFSLISFIFSIVTLLLYGALIALAVLYVTPEMVNEFLASIGLEGIEVNF